MSMPVPPPDTRAPGQTGHIADHNTISDALATLESAVQGLQGAAADAAQGIAVLQPSGDIAGVTDRANIQALINLGAGLVTLAAGAFYLNAALTVYSGTQLAGAGSATTISQLTAAANGIQGVDVEYVTLRDFTLLGPGSGSGDGVKLTRSANPNIPYCTFENVQAATWGNCGFLCDVLIVSRFAGCIARSNGGDGFQLTSAAGNTTSVAFEACYANANSGIGYELDSTVYSTLSSCAADHNAGGGYALFGAQACALKGCGSEANTGTSVLLAGGAGNTVDGLWVNVNSGIGVSVASGESGATLTGCVENSASGATAFIKSAAGTSCVVVNPKSTTANSFAAGTAYSVTSAGGVVH